MIEAIAANAIHEKQLAPHLRKRLGGGISVIINETSPEPNPPAIFTAVAGENLTKNKFGYFYDGKVYAAGLNLQKPAHCFILSDAEADEEVMVASHNIEIHIDGTLNGDPYLYTNGDLDDSPPAEHFVQKLGTKMTDDSFILHIQDAEWYEVNLNN